MGQIAHLRNSSKLCLYHNVDEERKKTLISPVWELIWFLFCLELNPLHPKRALCQVWLKLAHWLWRRRLFNSVNVFLLFRNYLPWERWWSFNWTNLNPMLCAKFCWNWSSDSGEDDENMKSLQTDGQTTSERSRLSFQLTGTTTDILYMYIV